MDFLPPEPQVAEDLSDLLKILADKGAKEYLQQLKAASEDYVKRAGEFHSKITELSSKEYELQVKAKIQESTDASIKMRNADLVKAEQDFHDREDELKRAEKDLSEKFEQYRLGLQKLDHDKRHLAQNHNAQMANLVEWERNLKADMERHSDKVKALKELTYG